MKKNYFKIALLLSLIVFLTKPQAKADTNVDSISVTIYCDVRDTLLASYNNAMYITGSFTNPGGNWFLRPMESVINNVWKINFKYLPGSIAGDTTDFYFATADDWSESSREIVPAPCNRSWNTQRTFVFDIYKPDSIVAFKFGKCEPVPVPRVSGLKESIVESLKIYPNPTNGIINIDLSSFNSNAIVEVLDISGRVITKIENATVKATLDISTMNSGIYLIRVSDSVSSVYRKIILN